MLHLFRGKELVWLKRRAVLRGNGSVVQGPSRTDRYAMAALDAELLGLTNRGGQLVVPAELNEAQGADLGTESVAFALAEINFEQGHGASFAGFGLSLVGRNCTISIVLNLEQYVGS
jgi:hypothetical protein